MYKYVLFFLALTVFLAVTVSAEYFNGTWLERKSESYVNGEDYDIRPDEELIRFMKESAPEEADLSHYTIGIRPPDKFPRPLSTVKDSLEINESRVMRKTQIPGIRIEKYYFIPLESFKAESMENKFDTLWQKNDSRISKWSSEGSTKGTSVSDLKFALPVGGRFEKFVGGQTRLDINGSQKITFSGRSEWTEGQIETSASKNSSFPALTMKQEPRFSIRGNVGERVTVDIQQDASSQSLSNFEENIKLKYQGEKDEIIQAVDAGNISLNLEGATFAGYRGSHKGLFGIRTEGRVGPLRFTAIASQEKSEANVKTFRGSAEEKSTQIKDYQYKTNTYFFLDKNYMEQFQNARTSLDQIMYSPRDSLVVIEVYVDDANNSNNLSDNAIRGVAKPMSLYPTKNQVYDETGLDGFYHRLDPQRDYYVDRGLGFIVFTNRVQDTWTVGVYVETKDGRKYGKLAYDPNDPASKIELKLIKAKSQRPSNQDTWDLEWKNVYDLGQRNIDLEGLEIRIYREATDGVSRDTQDGTPFIHILGLDNADEFGNLKPDNKIDLNRGFVNQYRGELIFPLLRPFDSGTPQGVSVELKEKVPEIYDTQNFDEKVEKSKYYIEVQTANRQAVIQIGGGIGGIMEGTEQVLLNGKALANGTDYRINYMTGELTLLNQEALSPTADLVIKYEEMNAFQQMQKSLLGVRTEYDLWQDSKIGATFLFNNESTRDKRVRIGQEPSRMFLFDTDTQLNFQPKVLTTMIDKIPLVVANEASKIQIEGEVAKSMPNMNTRGVVYVDDFEGSKNLPLSIIRTAWTKASQPDNGRDMVRGRLNWYNPWDRIESRIIWPNKDTTAGENTVHVLTLGYGKPEGVPSDNAYDGVMTAFYGTGEDLSRSRFIEVWAKGSRGVLNIDIGSVSEDWYVDDYVDADGVKRSGKNFLNTEDRPIPGQGQGDNTLTKEEDTGLDGVFDRNEDGYDSKNNPDPFGDDWNYNDKNDYSRINGTEGNAVDSDRAGIPDTEDINHNGILDTKNSYYEYSITFEDSSRYYVDGSYSNGWRLYRIPLWSNPDATVGGTEAPDPTKIEFARMWISQTDTTLIQIAAMEIVESSWLESGIFDDEGNDMLKDTESSPGDGKPEALRVTRVNTHENNNYSPPREVKIEIDPETKVERMEQSIVLEFENLRNNHTAFMYRTFEKMDFTDYTSLKMYVHGSDNMPEAPKEGRDFELVFRFGGDKQNYYEYRSPVYRGWAKENYVDIDFESCTQVKFNRDTQKDNITKMLGDLQDSLNVFTDSLLATDSSLAIVKERLKARLDSLTIVSGDLDKPGAYVENDGTKVFTLAGNPSLQNIKVISIGIRNNTGETVQLEDVWFDELRMDKLRDMGGTAARFKINTDLAGFINISGNGTWKDDDFHDMNTKKGTGQDAKDWNSSIKVNMDRFAPKRWNLNLPVTASISKTDATPRLKSGSDIILADDQKKEFRSWTSDKKYHITYRKGVDTTKKGLSPTNLNWDGFKGSLINWATEKVNADFDWGQRISDSPMSGYEEGVNKQTKITYDVNPTGRKVSILGWLLKKDEEPETGTETKTKTTVKSSKKTFKDRLADIKFAYTPNELNYNYTKDDNNRFKTNIDGVSDSTRTNKVNEIYNFGYLPIEQITYRYQLTQEKDLTIPRDNKVTGYNESNTITFKPPGIPSIFTHNYNYNASYKEDDNPRYSLSSQLGSKTINFNKTFQASGTVTWFNVLKYMKAELKLPAKKDDSGKKDAESQEKKPEEKSPPAPESQGADSTRKGESKKENELKEPFRNRMIDGLMKTFSPVMLEYRNTNQFQKAGITDRPSSFIDRFKGKISEPDSNTVVTRQNTEGSIKGYSARTDLKLPLDVGLSTKMSYGKEEQLTSSAQTLKETYSYPDVTLNWAKAENIMPFMKKYISNTNVSSAYSKNNEKNYRDYSIEPQSEKTSEKFSPLISVSTAIKKFQINFSMSKSQDKATEVTGSTVNYTTDDKSDIRTRFQYRLSSSKGLFGMKLKSDIEMSLEFFISNSARYKKISGDTPVVIEGEEMTNEPSLISSTDSWGISPNVQYRFSKNFNGGAKLDFQNSTDMTNKVRKIREVSVWGELTF
ncbi:cell surface protein SprA [bacterium]|nr:cell surface protein SprA [bacterium]